MWHVTAIVLLVQKSMVARYYSRRKQYVKESSMILTEVWIHLLRHPIVPCNSCCSTDSILHQWCNGWHTLLECDRSWVRAQSSQTKDYKISICCFSAKHAALRRKSKDWLAWDQENVFKLSNMTYLTVNCCFSELALKKYN